MKNEELDAIEARANAATPGPWLCRDIPYDGVGDPIIETADGTYIAQTVYDMQSTTVAHEVDADTGFIAHAREDIPRLVAEVRRLQEALRTIQEQTVRSERDSIALHLMEDITYILENALPKEPAPPVDACPKCGEPMAEYEEGQFCDCGWRWGKKER